MTILPDAFLRIPLAHRALHDVTEGRPENSRAAILAAIEAGYGVEIDVQQSSDGAAVVFHDYHLDRLTHEEGFVKDRTLSALSGVQLYGNNETIPSLPEVLDLIGGKVPLLIEIKDQDGAMGPNVGLLEQAVSNALQNYDGLTAVMSFNPFSVQAMAQYSPDVPRGLVTGPMVSEAWDHLSEDRREHLRAISDYDAVGASFISHQRKNLQSSRVKELKQHGASILCWTVTGPLREKKARKVADNITFEGYLPELSQP